MNKENYRFYIFMRFKLGFDAKSIHADFVSIFGDNAISYDTVARWIRHFKDGRQGFEDEPRVGRPITGKSDANIDLVRNIIEDNPYVTYDEIEAETSLCRGTIYGIIHDCLKLKKVTSRWVPHLLSDKNRQDRIRVCEYNLERFRDNRWRLCDVVTGDESWFFWRQIGRKQSHMSWIGEGESPRTVVRQGRFEPKTMVSIFFRTSGAEQITYWDKGKTVDSESYINDCLNPLVSSLQRQRKQSGVKNLKFHHDNARPHVAQAVIEFLEGQEFIMMEQPPYSPDLAPSDFWLFDYIKERLDNHTSAESLVRQITKILRETPKKEFQKTFEKWIERMDLCIKFKGDYFEHEIK